MTWLKIGQKFAINNIDYYVLEDEWVIVDIDYPTVTFSNNKRWAVDTTGILPFSTDTIVGKVFSETDEVAIIALSGKSFGYEVGILLKENRASYLNSLDPIIYS
ncbi:hypothetical protein [Nostoc sp. 106C]|uniref:hypothetical protein n=1 Tax=Nostoc sp. 106C TaxID=1932667 RepID=UPI000A398E66|nr:hypothetical protein [Nostoc sp. 106C]OUL29927.1 hypothetical protein BV375_15045 [Nostoc sp. 106C]